MQIKISKKNSKIGSVPNLSLTPGASCVPGIPCFTDGCYAKNAYLRFPNVKKAWDANLKFYEDNSEKFFDEFNTWLRKNKPERFRLFVGGDFPGPAFYYMLEGLASGHPDTSFLVFTKRYEYDYSGKPDNLQVVLSTWPGVPLPTNTDLPWAWLEEDARRRKSYPHFVCPGGCQDCGHSCWDKLDSKTHVTFPRH